MELTRLERAALNHLSAEGPMGVSTLVRHCAPFDAVPQAKNVLMALQAKGATSLMSNGQWRTNADFMKQAREQGWLSQPAQVDTPKPVALDTPRVTVKQDSNAAVDNAPTAEQPDPLGAIPAFSDRKPAAPVAASPSDTASEKTATSVVAMLRELPDSTSIRMDATGVEVDWAGLRFNPPA
jgi:hypothetical protein